MKTLTHLRPSMLALALLTAYAAPAIAQQYAVAGATGYGLAEASEPAQQALGMVAKTGALSLDLAFGQMDRRVEVAEQAAPDGSRVTLAYERSLRPTFTSGSGRQAPGERLTAFSLVSKSKDGSDYSFGFGGVASRYFGAGGLDIGEHGAIAAVPALANPFISLMPNASHAGVSSQLGGIKVKFGVFTTGAHHVFATQAFDPATLSPALVASQPRVNSQLLEFSKSYTNAAVSFSLMRSRENSQSYANGSALNFGPGALTKSMQLTGVWLLAPKVAFAAQATYGYTAAGVGTAESVSTRTNAFSLALVASDRYHAGDRLSIAVSQPIRPYQGGTAVSALPIGRELLAELNYVRPLNRTGWLGWSLAVRRNPDNVADAPMDKLIAVRYQMQF